MNRAFQSATALTAAVRQRQIGCRELLELYWSRVEALNPAINALIETDIEAARRRADDADAALQRGENWGPLHGLPISLKETIDVEGMHSTWGVPALRDHVAPRNALVTDRLLGAGAILFGKSNIPLLLNDIQSFNDIYGTTNNPWDATRTAGGSSGGSSAAIAAGLTALEAGSDVGGSIRIPAHYCGIYAHKPSFGLVPPRGHALANRITPTDISVVGPMARSADDLALALRVMAGPDPIEATAYRLELPEPSDKPLSAYRIAVIYDDPIAPVDSAITTQLQSLVTFLGAQGAVIDERARPDFSAEWAWELFLKLLRAAISGKQSDEEFKRNQELVKALSPDEHGYYADGLRGLTLPFKEWLNLNEDRHCMRVKWVEFFRNYDLLICPAATTVAFPHDHSLPPQDRRLMVNGAPRATTDSMFWAGYFGGAYLPGTIAPIGVAPDGLPVGVQIVGGPYADLSCIRLAHLIERQYHSFVAPPALANS